MNSTPLAESNQGQQLFLVFPFNKHVDNTKPGKISGQFKIFIRFENHSKVNLGCSNFSMEEENVAGIPFPVGYRKTGFLED